MRSSSSRACLALCLLSVVGPTVAATVEDHRVLSRYPGSVATRRDNDGFMPYKLVVGLGRDGATDDELLKTLAVEGNLTRLAYENPKDRSAHEIFMNYREALQSAGFEILFSCVEKECGPSYAGSRWGRVTGMKYFAPDMRYLSARHAAGDRRVYVAILVAKLRHQVEVLEEAEMKRGLVTAQAIAQGLSVDGRVVLDGLLFDHDKAVLKPDSKPALEVIAQYLADHPDQRAYIVGHSDGTGALAHNLDLSRARAQAVVAALVNDHAVAADRLEAHGVGPLSPAKTNLTEDGRARNRRVEMVGR